MNRINERRFLRYTVMRPCYLEWEDEKDASAEAIAPCSRMELLRCRRALAKLKGEARRTAEAVDETLSVMNALLDRLAQDRPQPQAARQAMHARCRRLRASRHALMRSKHPAARAIAPALARAVDRLFASWRMAQLQHGMSLVPAPDVSGISKLDGLGEAGACLSMRMRRLYARWEAIAQLFARRLAVHALPPQPLDLGAGGVGVWLAQDEPVAPGRAVGVVIALSERDIFAARGTVSFCRQMFVEGQRRWRIGIDFRPVHLLRQRLLIAHIQAQEVRDTIATYAHVPGMETGSGGSMSADQASA